MSVRLQRQSLRRESASLDDDLRRVRRRMEVTRANAIERLERLKRFLANEGDPKTQRDFVRLTIQLELAHEAVAEAAGMMK